MKSHRTILIFSILLILAVLACNINAAPPPSSQSAIATIVARTMQAVVSASPTAPAVFNTPVLSTPSPTAMPMAVIKTATECRSGPGENYESITSVNPNQKSAVLGKDPSGNYWLIQTDSGECWVGMQYVTVTGDTQDVPEMTPPPVTKGVPAKPGSLYYQYSCSFGSLTTHTHLG